MFRRSTVLASAAVLAVAVAPVLAQEVAPQQKMLWAVHQEMVNPAKMAEYVSTTREFVDLVATHRDVMPHFSMLGFEDEEMNFTYVVPVHDFGAIGGLDAEIEALFEKAGPEKVGDLFRRNGDTLRSIRQWVAEEHPELSYRPAKPRLALDDMRFWHYDFYYVQPGHEMEAEQVARDFATLYAAKGIADGWRFFESVMGEDLPCYFVAVGARDEADYREREAANRRILGKEGEALFARAFAITRHFESHELTLRPDLSAPVAAQPVAAK